MYLSKLVLDPHRRATRELRTDGYLLHQAVYRAFPSAAKGGPGRVLYRLDCSRDGETVLLVQSEKQPDWTKAERLLECLKSPPLYKEYSPAVRAGQRLYFRLRANPVAKRATPDRPDLTRRFGLVKENEQLQWLARKGAQHGFRVLSCSVVEEGKIKMRGLTHFAVLYEGILEVLEPERFLTAVRCGIGPAKGFGFGLFSVAPV